jgi:endonuclease G
MDSFEGGRQDQLDEMGRRVKDRVERRRRNVDVLRQEGGIAKADDPDRVAARIDRLSRYYADVRPISPAGITAGDPTAMRAATAVLERVINTADFLGVRYLEVGVLAAQSVGRVNMREPNGRIIGYGSGSLVSPHLLLTNHHVLPDTQAAAASTIEFNFQDLTPTKLKSDCWGSSKRADSETGAAILAGRKEPKDLELEDECSMWKAAKAR